jgi:hypothetical protein
MTCPYCGHDDDQEAFFHPDDIEAIQAHVLWAAEKDLGHAVEEMTRNFNRRTRNNFFSITREVEGDEESASIFPSRRSSTGSHLRRLRTQIQGVRNRAFLSGLRGR